MPVYDILLEVTSVPNSSPPAGTYNFTFGNVSGTNTMKSAEVTGFYKTILKWLKCLLTIPGTDLTDTSYGSGFTALFGGNITTAQDVQDFVMQCVQQTTATIQSYQSGVIIDPVEILQNANITQFIMRQSLDGFDVYVTLTNSAGQQLIVSLPLDFNPPTTLANLPPGIQVGS